jgi:DNA topoisomerase-1
MPTTTIAGDCNVYFDGRRETRQRGHVLVVVKPDDTVLVHDADGYQPVAWLTRPADDVSEAGTPVGNCRCGGQLIRSGGDVLCLDCAGRHSLPSGATTLDSTCDCGLPLFRVERGTEFELCLDYECGSLLDAVSERFDRAWDCPNCDGDLRVLRRGGLIAGCENYPDCDTGFSIPDGTISEPCDCGLPRFETASGERCLDSGCGATL